MAQTTTTTKGETYRVQTASLVQPWGAAPASTHEDAAEAHRAAALRSLRVTKLGPGQHLGPHDYEVVLLGAGRVGLYRLGEAI